MQKWNYSLIFRGRWSSVDIDFASVYGNGFILFYYNPNQGRVEAIQAWVVTGEPVW